MVVSADPNAAPSAASALVPTLGSGRRVPSGEGRPPRSSGDPPACQFGAGPGAPPGLRGWPGADGLLLEPNAQEPSYSRASPARQGGGCLA